MRSFTREELTRGDGKDGRPCYVAFEGKVYDLSGSFLWRRGRHQVRHLAGLDYTGGLDDAPHGAELLERFPAVGVLTRDEPAETDPPAPETPPHPP